MTTTLPSDSPREEEGGKRTKRKETSETQESKKVRKKETGQSVIWGISCLIPYLLSTQSASPVLSYTTP
jgi:hypothetical protein